MDPDISAESLQRKVQFDLRLHFARRGCENMETMCKDHFKLLFYVKNESWFVVKAKDELTKNHKEIEQIVSGIIPENKDDRLCPVRSYRLYMDHLNPDNPFLWQHHLEKINPNRPDVWYGLQHIGKNTLGKFMTLISSNCQLLKAYTNHSIRVTGISVLTRQNFTASEIMSITGHKSVQTLANYQRTQNKQEMEMGQVLYQSMTRNESQISRRNNNQDEELGAVDFPVSPPQPQLAIAPKHNMDMTANISKEKAVVPFQPDFSDQEVPDFDLVSILDDLEKEKKQQNNNSVQATSNVVNNVPRSMFANCQIQNVTFNIQK